MELVSAAGVRIKMSALWAATLLLFAYGDIFGFFRAGFIHDVTTGEVEGIRITQGFLLATSAYIAIPCVMVFLCLVLRAGVNRWTNIVLGAVYAVTVVAFSIGESWAYYYLLTAVETVLLVLIVWYAWTWPASGLDRRS
jgi:hypothetical protein